MWIADKLIYRNEDDFVRAYQGSELVWELPNMYYYVRWTPSYLQQGTFTMFGGHWYWFASYPSGCFSWSGSAYIPSEAFATDEWNTVNITTMETNVKIIENSAFQSCSLLSQINCSMCESVGWNAFYNCSSLTSVSLPVCSYMGIGGLDGTGISEIYLPRCEYVDGYAFAGCPLTQVSLPVCSFIGAGGFSSCSSLGQINLPACEKIGSNAFQFCYSLSKIILPVCSYIEYGAFRFCTSLSLLVLGSNSVVHIDSSYSTFYRTLFESCSGSIYVPESLVNAYKSAPGWSSLSCVILPMHYIQWTPSDLNEQFRIDGVTYNMSDYNGYFVLTGESITSSAFINTNITTLNTDVPYIGYRAFQNCVSLTSVSISKCSTIGDQAFINCYNTSRVYAPVCERVIRYAFQNCHSLESIDLPECSFIGSNAFYGCEKISYVNLPKCDYVDYRGFRGCDIRSLNLSSCTQIGELAFGYNSNLSVVSLSKCHWISYAAFYGCTSLQSIYLYFSMYPCEISSNTFFGTGITSSTGSIFVPRSLVNQYKNESYWSNYSNRIFAIPT